MTMLHIVDVSAHQAAGVLDTIPAVDIVLVKATEGRNYTSSTFARQYASAKTRARRRGGYHFARPEESSAHDQCSRFLDVVQPVAGEIVMLDLEASKLTQADTNKWARQFGDDLADQAGDVADWLYMGAGYATNNTGKGLAAHFSRWMYPQYPSRYLLARVRHAAMRARGVHPRSAQAPRKVPLARMTTAWPPAVSPWLPSGIAATGWNEPDVWQFTDNWRGLDASVSARTLDQLAAGGHLLEDDMAQVSSLGAGGTLRVPAGGHADMPWTTEFTDRHKLHGDKGVSVVIAADTYWCLADAQFELHGLTPGATLDIAWTRVKDDGTFIDDAWRKTFTANAAGVIRDELGGQFSVNASNRLRLRLYNPGSTALSLTVVAADANKIPVTMAKATLLKY